MINSRSLFLASLVFAAACGTRKEGGGDVDGGEVVVDAEPCTELGCFIEDCAAKGLPPTKITGKVFAPNGTLPLYGVNVYIPASDPGPLTDGAVCDRCANGLPGGSWVSTTTKEDGSFELIDVPATANVPLIIQTGKWRKKLMLPNVAACQDLPLSTAETSLPKNKSEGDLPKIAITTGNADALECLPRKLGIDDSEFTTDAGDGRVNLFAGNGTNKFAASHPTGVVNFPAAATLWDDADKLKSYDIVFFSCEGGQNPANKPQSALDKVKAYADLGGRVFLSHWHNIWIQGAHQSSADAYTQQPAVWGGMTGGVATWNNYPTTFTTPNDQIDEAGNPTNTKITSFATWMENVAGSPAGMRGQIPIQTSSGKVTISAVDTTKAEQWVLWPGTATASNRPNVPNPPQIFQFTTPNEEPLAARCGKVVFSDMHVASGSTSNSNVSFPGTGTNNGCSTSELTPQEKALAFIFFDIASCVGVIN